MSTEHIEKIQKVGKKNRLRKLNLPNRDHFEALMRQEQKQVTATEQAKVTKAQEVDPVSKPSLLEEVRNVNQRVGAVENSHASPRRLIAQAQDVIQEMETIKKRLETPNVELKSSVRTMLRKKLDHIDQSLRIALNKAGVEYVPEKASVSMMGPIERFVGYLTNGQEALRSLATDVQKKQDNNQSFSPADMLLVQMKVSIVQQQLEFFTNVLNKSLESTKTIMNVQV